jgi:hypothetical protein
VLVLGVLLALPPGIRELELACPCAGTLLLALQRFRRLEALWLIGNAADVLWDDAGPAAAGLPTLRALRLDYRQPPSYWNECTAVLQLPTGAAAALGAATRLTCLELRAEWSQAASDLCSGLPALRELR